MSTSEQLEAQLIYLCRIHNLLIDLQKICLAMSRRTPDRHLISYRRIPLVGEDITPIGGPGDLVEKFGTVGSYRLVLQGMKFTPPPLEAKAGLMECTETEIIAGGLRKMIGDLTGTWHTGPLWEISGAGLYTELKRRYILSYLRYFLAVAEAWAHR